MIASQAQFGSVHLLTQLPRWQSLPCARLPFAAQAQKCRRRSRPQPHRWREVAALAGEVPSSTLTFAETAALDQLIDELLDASDSSDLTKRVADNMLSFDQRFWLRLATRADTAGSGEERERLTALARVVMQLADAMVRRTNEQLADSAAVLQAILRAAADELTGEWVVPLPADKLAALAEALEQHADRLDEALLSNCFAWMRKAAEDKLDGMVALLQKVLQLYAARALRGATPPAGGGEADAAVQQLLACDESAWAGELRQRTACGEVSEPSFMEALQRRMESVVLGLSSGSYAQRVQAEYLKELESRAKGVFADIAAGK